MDLKPLQIIIATAVLLVSSTVGAIVYFTPMGYAEQTRQMVVEITLKDQLHYYEKQAWEYKKECTDLKVKDSWFCSEEDKKEYDKILLEIKLLKVKLGIG